MFNEELYVRTKLADLYREPAVPRWPRAADPEAEVPRTGVGVRHEVFRRIAGDGVRARPSFWRRLRFAS